MIHTGFWDAEAILAIIGVVSVIIALIKFFIWLFDRKSRSVQSFNSQLKEIHESVLKEVHHMEEHFRHELEKIQEQHQKDQDYVEEEMGRLESKSTAIEKNYIDRFSKITETLHANQIEMNSKFSDLKQNLAALTPEIAGVKDLLQQLLLRGKNGTNT